VKFFVEFVGVTMGIGDFHVAFDNFRIPELMKVGRIVLALRMRRLRSGS